MNRFTEEEIEVALIKADEIIKQLDEEDKNQKVDLQGSGILYRPANFNLKINGYHQESVIYLGERKWIPKEGSVGE